MAADAGKHSFWDHLGVLWAAITKSPLTIVFGIVASCFNKRCKKGVFGL